MEASRAQGRGGYLDTLAPVARRVPGDGRRARAARLALAALVHDERNNPNSALAGKSGGDGANAWAGVQHARPPARARRHRALHPVLDPGPRAQAHLEAGRGHDDRRDHRLRADPLQRHHPRAPGDSVDIGLGIGCFVGLLASLGLLAAGYLRQAIYTDRKKPPGRLSDGSPRRPGPQPRRGAGEHDGVRRARLRALDRPRRQGGRRRRRRRRDAHAARHGLDGRRRGDRRGREGRGADALQRRADRRRLAA